MSRFFCEVRGRAQPKTFAGDAKSGISVVIAGEYGALRIRVGAAGKRDKFEITFEPWRSSMWDGERGVEIAWGELNYDRFMESDKGGVIVRLGDEVLEAFKFCSAKKIMMEGIPDTTD